MGHSVLQVPVPALEPFVRARHEHYDRAYLSQDPAFVHAHITVLGPFLDELDDASASVIADIAGKVAPFDIRLERLATFPDGVIHLLPEPAAPFQAAGCHGFSYLSGDTRSLLLRTAMSSGAAEPVADVLARDVKH